MGENRERRGVWQTREFLARHGRAGSAQLPVIVAMGNMSTLVDLSGIEPGILNTLSFNSVNNFMR